MTALDYDALAAEYTQYRRVQPEVLKHLLSRLSLTGASRILEVGCGTGSYLLALAEATGCQAWGIDPSREMLRSAQQKAEALPAYSEGRIRLQQGQAECLDLPEGNLDLVFSVDMIHHASDPARYFQEAYRVLKPGGLICTVTDSEDIIRRRQPLSVYFPETVEQELKRYPPIPSLRHALQAAGFCQLTEEQVGFAYPLTDLSVYQAKAFSCLHLISEPAFQAGLQRLQADLKSGPVQAVSRYILLWGVKD